MTASIIIQLLSIVMLMLLAVPGTQWIWKFGNSEIRKYGNKVSGNFRTPIAVVREMAEREKKLEVKEIRKPGLFTELSKIATAIF